MLKVQSPFSRKVTRRICLCSLQTLLQKLSGATGMQRRVSQEIALRSAQRKKSRPKGVMSEPGSENRR